MYQALHNFEQASRVFLPLVTVALGIISLILGLCLWLSGLRLIKIIAAVLGALLGCLCAYLVAKGKMGAIILSTVIGAGFALFFQKQTLILTGGVITVALSIVIFTHVETPLTDYTLPVGANGGLLSPAETVFELKTQLILILSSFVENARNLSGPIFIISIVAGLIVIGFGMLLPRFITTVVLAILGTGLIFTGMIFLLLYKHSMPITHIYSKIHYYGIAAAGMVGFGTVVGLLLCPGRKKKKADQKSKDGEKK